MTGALLSVQIEIEHQPLLIIRILIEKGSAVQLRQIIAEAVMVTIAAIKVTREPSYPEPKFIFKPSTYITDVKLAVPKDLK